MKKVKQNNRFKHELKMTSLFKNLRVSEEFETLGKNGGEGSHTWKRSKEYNFN